MVQVSRGDLEQIFRENAYRVISLDLSIPRNQVLLGISGSSWTVISLGASSWSVRMLQGDGTLGDPLDNTMLQVGSRLILDFQDLSITNPAGSGQLVIFVGRRV